MAKTKAKPVAGDGETRNVSIEEAMRLMTEWAGCIRPEFKTRKQKRQDRVRDDEEAEARHPGIG